VPAFKSAERVFEHEETDVGFARQVVLIFGKFKFTLFINGGIAMAIVVGIDGTGSAFLPGSGRDKEYDVAFANSFVRQICNKTQGKKQYFRGPVALGGGLVDAINQGCSFIKSKYQQSPEPVLLTGYSRGAAGSVALAKKLKGVGIPVQAIMLFDCVDRHVVIDAEIIPDTVGNVLHVIRDPAASSRESFGNDGLSYHKGKTNYGIGPGDNGTAYKFMCTHGGMGGCPWKPEPGQSPNDFINEGFGAGWYDGATKITFAQDQTVSAQVWAFCVPFLQRHGFIS